MVTSARPLRVVVFTCGELGIKAANEISRLDGVASVTVMRTPYRTVTRTGLNRLRHVLRYNGVVGAAKAAWSSLWENAHQLPDAPAVPVSSAAIQVLEFEDFHDADCIAALTELAPDLGVVAGTYILKPAVFSVPRLGSINLHTGKAPEYRGSAPGFWEMYNGETRVGITIHEVAAGVDAGAILRQEVFAFNNAPDGDPFAYLRSYRRDVLEPNGLRLLVATVRAIIGGTVTPVTQDAAAARTYRVPTHRQKTELRRRVAQRRRQGWKRNTKRALGWFIFNSGLYRRFTAGKAIVVLFHRVDDRYARNPISCTTQQFEQYCRFFARYFDVISAGRLLELMEKKADLSGKLVITFDDGYADNVAAARVLRELALPACFFIATDFIGTDRTGWWDVQQGHRSYWMTWDDIRQLDEWGFEIGAHTCSHADLGVVTGAEAVAEITGSKDVLETQLGTTIEHFAYPFGSRRHITEANRLAIRDAGLRTCMSAYGGFVTVDSDPYDIQRYAISPWHRSLWQLGLEMMLEPAADSPPRMIMPGIRPEESGHEVPA